jgi:4-carboxymuconolactone decarboxylase
MSTIPALGREPPLDPGQLTPEQREVVDELAGARGALPAPYRFLLHSPDVARGIGGLGTRLRESGVLSPREYEMVVLLTARHLGCEFVQRAHERIAPTLGLDPREVRALLEGTFQASDPREAAVCEVTQALHAHARVPDAIAARARQTLGARGVAEVIGYIGIYTVTCYTMRYTGA